MLAMSMKLSVVECLLSVLIVGVWELLALEKLHFETVGEKEFKKTVTKIFKTLVSNKISPFGAAASTY